MRRRLRGARKHILSLAAVCGLALAISLPSPAGAANQDATAPVATPVEVRSGLHEGFARIVVQWKRLPAFHAKGDKTTVDIRFARALDADLGPLVSSLQQWVTSAEILADGQTVRLHLARELDLRSFPLGNMAVIDLIDAEAVARAAVKEREEGETAVAETLSGEVAAVAPSGGTTPADHTESAEPAKQAEREAAREHASAPAAKTQSTTPQPTPAAPEPKSAVAEAAVGADLPTPDQAAQAAAAQIDAMQKVRQEAQRSVVEAAPSIAVDGKNHGSFSRLIFTWNSPIDYEVERSGKTVSILFAAPGKVDIVSLRRDLPERFSSVDSVMAEGKLLFRVGMGEQFRLRHFQKGKRIVIDALDGAGATAASRPSWASQDVIAKPGESDSLLKLAEASRKMNETSSAAPNGFAVPNMAGRSIPAANGQLGQHPAPMAEDQRMAPASVMERPLNASERVLAAELPTAPPLKVAAESISGGMRMRFDWDRRVGAGVFRRMGYLWVVFDVPRIVDLAKLGTTDGMTGAILSADQIAAPGATVLRFGIASDLWPRVARSGDAWLVEITDAPLPPAKPLLVRAEPSAKGGARVLVPTPGAERKIEFSDPEVGDSLAVVPVSEPGVGIKTGRAFVQFDIMPSAQGLAVNTRADDVAIDAKVTGVEITSKTELYMSADTVLGAHRTAEVSDGLSAAMGPLFEYEAWRRDDLGDYHEAKRYLLQAVVSAGIETRTERRMSLATFHFAHGLAEDAIGVIQRIAEDDPKSLERPDFLALRGATLMLLGRSQEAAEDLGKEILDGDMDVTLWRAALIATRGDWEGADSAFAISGPAFERLPADLRARFGLLAAHAALSVGNFHRVNRLVERIEAEAPDESHRMEALFLRATAYQRTGKTEAALKYFSQLAEDGSRPVQARSELARVELMLHLGRMNRSDAIEALERLRHSWRGDSFEQLLLRRLAELYREEENYINALQAMRDAVERFPDSLATPEVSDQMQRMFADLFIEGAADTLSPLTALSLYYEFGDLSQDGAAGGRIAEGLANRLVDVDLLDRAAELLERQLDVVAGVDKARIGARLAIIQLLDQEAGKALETLKLTRGEGIEVPVALMQRRRHLEARALSEIGDSAAALALVEKDESREAGVLRADIHWNFENWAEAGVELAKILSGHEIDQENGQENGHAGEITVDDQHLVMRHAVALMLSGDTDGLAGLRGTYSERMAKSAYRDAFELITKSTSPDEVPVRQLPKILANIEGAEAFLRSYKDSPKEDQGALN
jgi:tetratricopeptide (TPR) repeat protein